MSSSLSQLHDRIISGDQDAGFIRLYSQDGLQHQKQRYCRMLEWAQVQLPGTNGCFISAPGRTELGGNHTDHNNGRVLAAAVDLDCVALVSPDQSLHVELYSEELKRTIKLDLDDLTVNSGERGTPESLIRGIAAAFQDRSQPIGGFRGIINSSFKPGSGLSSSAAFSVLIGAVFTQLFSDTPLSPVALAQAARYAENSFFGKPCGLMDQMSSAVGEIISIDFKNPDDPVITKIIGDFNDSRYQLTVLDTGSSHAELTPEYAAIPEEIGQALEVFDRSVARGLTIQDVIVRAPQIREHAGDRALLRLLHFIEEDRRAQQQADALQRGDFSEFLRLVKQSGDSSCKLLQNCVPHSDIRNQGVLLALALTPQVCPGAICRVHGGGFAGTIQAYIPTPDTEHYKQTMEEIFGRDSVLPVKTGRPGVCVLSADGWYFPETMG